MEQPPGADPALGRHGVADLVRAPPAATARGAPRAEGAALPDLHPRHRAGHAGVHGHERRDAAASAVHAEHERLHGDGIWPGAPAGRSHHGDHVPRDRTDLRSLRGEAAGPGRLHADRKSTRLNSSHVAISYAVFCLKKKTTKTVNTHV